MPSKRGIVALVIFVLLATFSPWLYGQVWFFLHRDGIEYMGKVIPASRGWVRPPESWEVTTGFSYVHSPTSLWRFSEQGFWMMSFGRETIPRASADQIVMSLGKAMQLTKCQNCEVIGPFIVDSRTGKSWCVTETFPGSQAADVRCSLFNATWTAQYLGPKSREDDFFKVISGIEDR